MLSAQLFEALGGRTAMSEGKCSAPSVSPASGLCAKNPTLALQPTISPCPFTPATMLSRANSGFKKSRSLPIFQKPRQLSPLNTCPAISFRLEMPLNSVSGPLPLVGASKNVNTPFFQMNPCCPLFVLHLPTLVPYLLMPRASVKTEVGVEFGQSMLRNTPACSRKPWLVCPPLAAGRM